MKVTGIAEAVEKYKGKYSTDPSIKINIQLTESGLLLIKDAFIHFEVIQVEEKKEDKDSSWSFFGGKKEDKKDEKENKEEGTGSGDGEDSETTSTSTTAKATKTPAADKKVSKTLF